MEDPKKNTIPLAPSQYYFQKPPDRIYFFEKESLTAGLAYIQNPHLKVSLPSTMDRTLAPVKLIRKVQAPSWLRICLV